MKKDWALNNQIITQATSTQVKSKLKMTETANDGLPRVDICFTEDELAENMGNYYRVEFRGTKLQGDRVKKYSTTQMLGFEQRLEVIHLHKNHKMTIQDIAD